MMALYEDEKKKNEYKTRRIRQLEKILVDMGIDVPKDLFGARDGDLPPEDEIAAMEKKMAATDISADLLK